MRQKITNPLDSIGNINVLNGSRNRHGNLREIAIFSKNDIVGFEEILRKRMLENLDEQIIEKDDNFIDSQKCIDKFFCDKNLE